MTTTVSEPLETSVAAFLAAVRDDRSDDARQILDRSPAVAAFSIHTASAAADSAAVAAWLARDATLATQPHGPDATPPLMYACVSRVAAAGAGSDEARADVVRLLLDRGADPNTFAIEEHDPNGRLSVLFFACDRGYAGAAKLLLERGAEPNDGESIYHGAQRGHVDCLELLLAHSAEISGRHPRGNTTPLYFLAGHHEEQGGGAPWIRGFRWLLEHGADPNEWAYDVRETPLHTIARNGQCLVAAALLLDHGADPLRPRGDGRSPYAVAVRSGATEMIALLRSRLTTEPALLPIDRLIGACMRGDEAAARFELAAQPGLLDAVTDEDRAMLPQAAGRGLGDAVRLMVALGWDLGAEEPHGGTALHWAAWWGRPAVVRLLLEAGAPLNVRDRTYGSSPIAWAAHGSRFCRSADDDYCAIVEMLLDAGSDYDTSVNTWGEPPTSMGATRVSAVFARRGFGT